MKGLFKNDLKLKTNPIYNLLKCYRKNFSNHKQYFSTKSTIDKDYYLKLKERTIDTSTSKFRSFYYDSTLEYLVRTMDTIKFKLNDILFIGPNPDIFIKYLPQRKKIIQI